ncbi:hypothetical protein J6590_006843 [Homalodisca vitripennis]|nr:hypothetical protein J6590_006843 [Homalodisca vitripennis]
MGNHSKNVLINCDSDLIRQELKMSTSEESATDDMDEDPNFSVHDRFNRPKGVDAQSGITPNLPGVTTEAAKTLDISVDAQSGITPNLPGVTTEAAKTLDISVDSQSGITSNLPGITIEAAKTLDISVDSQSGITPNLPGVTTEAAKTLDISVDSQSGVVKNNIIVLAGPDQWKHNKAKRACISSEEYLSTNKK